mgnify:CR=1 FL=1
MSSQELRYLLYARKSSESEDRQMASIEDQINEVQKIAREKNLNIVGVYSESKSAKAPGRKAFNEMLLMIERGKADAILCWKLNRLARNALDGGKISWLLQNNIIKHIQCHGRDYKPSDNVLMMQVELGMANQFIKDLSTDIRRGARAKAERGWSPSPVLPIGYIHNKNRKGKVLEEEVTIDDKRFPIVKELWKLILTGNYSIASIKRKADELGLVGESKKPYALATYHHMFRSEFYCGYFYWKNQNGKKTRYKGKHQSIVTEAEFDRLQCLIGNRNHISRPKKHDYAYRGLLQCGKCGCAITAERKFQVRCTSCRYKFSCMHRDDCPKCLTHISAMKNPTVIDVTYYHCTKKRGKCLQKSVTEKDLENQYSEALKKILIPKEFYDFATEKLKVLNETENNESRILQEKLKKRKSSLENRLNSLTLMYADGDIDKNQFLSTKENTTKEIEQLGKEILKAEHTAKAWYTIAEDYLNLAKNAGNVLKERDNLTKRSLLSKLGSNQILKDKKLCFITAKPLLSIQDSYAHYNAEKPPFEPENPLEKQGDLEGFDTQSSVLCAKLRDVRTSIINYSQY